MVEVEYLTLVQNPVIRRVDCVAGLIEGLTCDDGGETWRAVLVNLNFSLVFCTHTTQILHDGNETNIVTI